MAKLFSTRLFGYSRSGVNDYISRLNEEFSRKLLERDQAHKGETEALRAEVERLTRENEQLQALRQEVADALISAKDYAAGLKRQADADDQAQRTVNAARQAAEARRLQDVAERISGLRRAFRGALEQMDGQLASYTEELQRLRAAAEGQAGEQGSGQKEGEAWEKKDGQAS